MPARNSGQARAVVQRAPENEDQRAEAGAARALGAVMREIDQRLAIIDASSVVGIRPDRLKLVALSTFTRTPALWTCDPVSIARAIVEAGQLGLEPTGLLGGAYLVPRANKATLLVGYRGLVILAMRSQLVQRVEARVVRAKDAFEYGYGLEPYLRHVPSQDPDPGAYTGAYAVIFYRDGSRQFDYMSIAEIEAIRGRSSAARNGPWVTDYAEMCKKTPLRRLMKLAPLTVEVAARLDEIDPEVAEGAAVEVGTSRQAELRAKLQAQLDAEYGGAPQLGAGGDQGADPGAGTTQATSGAGTAAGGDQGGSSATADAPAAARAPGEPTRQAEVAPRSGAASAAPQQCGVVHEGLGVGPCVLPAGHTELPWQDRNGADHAPQAEHEEAGGARWTMPRRTS